MGIMKLKSVILLVFAISFLTSCEKYEYTIPEPVSELTNDCIKRTLGPSIVSLPIEFAYAIALPATKGKIVQAKVEASIPGAAGTYLENRSFYTNASGVDVPVIIGSPSVNIDKSSTVDFSKDTNAVTLRYYYIVPEAARGQSVTFTFSAVSSDGKNVTYRMGPYTISKMSIKRNLAVSNGVNSYISIEDMAVYNSASASAIPNKIDLVYVYQATPVTFAHALVSPAAGSTYLPGITLPAGVNRNSKLRKAFALQDRNLSNLQYGIYVDDIDLRNIDMTDMPNYALGLKAEAGAWVETADKKYRAYVYVNSVTTTGTAVISMLRLEL